MEQTDLQILNGVKKKDVKTYEYIIEKYGRQVYCIAYNVLSGYGSHEDTEECVADVFWKAWETIENYDDTRGRFQTWLFVIAKYLALEYKRRLLRRMNVNITYEMEKHSDDGNSVERRIIEREVQEKLIRTINSFSCVDRELFLRRYFYQEKIIDLADTLQLTRSAVENRLFRGRKIIKDVLSHE